MVVLPNTQLINGAALKITPTPAAVANPNPQLTFPKNKPTPTVNIAIVAIDLAMLPVKLATTLHNVLPITSVDDVDEDDEDDDDPPAKTTSLDNKMTVIRKKKNIRLLYDIFR